MRDEHIPRVAGRGATRAHHLVNLRVSFAERDHWRALAKAEGLSLSAWLRRAAHAAAERHEKGEP